MSGPRVKRIVAEQAFDISMLQGHLPGGKARTMTLGPAAGNPVTASGKWTHRSTVDAQVSTLLSPARLTLVTGVSHPGSRPGMGRSNT